MSEDCVCCTAEEHRTATAHEAPVIRDGDPLEARLPKDVQVSLGRLLDANSSPTLGEWAGQVRRRVGADGGIAVEDLCHADGETAHWGEVAGERHYFVCFYDAVVLAALTDRPVDVRTESPDGTVIEAHATGDGDLTVTPEEAVFSFGVATDVEASDDGEVTHEDVYAAICPYVKAFPNEAAYEQWAEDAPAATVGIPLSGATGLASALVD